jgi:hypothetical protein
MMNERVKKLKLAASLWCDENIPDQWSDEINGYGVAWEEKFAELIVQECIRIVETQKVSVGNSVAGEMAAEWTMDALRECREEIRELLQAG